MFGAAHTMKLERWQKDLDVNLTGTFRVVQACLPGMREREYGRIVVISSTAAVHGMPAQIGYSTTKAGLLGLTKTVAAENVALGITCNVVLPGMTASSGHPRRCRRTSSTPGWRRCPRASSCARRTSPKGVAWFASPAAAFVTGQELTVDGGARAEHDVGHRLGGPELMRAAMLAALDGPDALSVVDVPEPAGAHPLGVGGRLLIEVHAAGVSFPDLLRSRGEYQMRPELPFATGAEAAGVVVEADPETGFAAGDRVAGADALGRCRRVRADDAAAHGPAARLDVVRAGRGAVSQLRDRVVRAAPAGGDAGGDRAGPGRGGRRRHRGAGADRGALDRGRLPRREGARGARAGRRRGRPLRPATG